MSSEQRKRLKPKLLALKYLQERDEARRELAEAQNQIKLLKDLINDVEEAYDLHE